MRLTDRIVRLPEAYDRERGAEVVAALGLATGPLADLVAGAAGSSPFLCGVLLKEVEWAAEMLAGAPEDALAPLLVAEAADDLAGDLRQRKRRIALLTALADLSGAWSLDQVTGALTDFADISTQLALTAAVASEQRRGKLPEIDDANAPGLTCIAMGKMGARELNYSSDIDLILLYDDERFEGDRQGAVRQSFVRATRAMTKTLSDRTGEGYVFRTDLRLRPDASVTPVVLSMEAAERYYESLGRTWERAAWIKARAAAGDVAAGRRFIDGLTPFVWRRHLDFAAIQDAHDIRLRIRDNRGLHAEPSHLGHDVKLGAGGIREIEFFTQTRQLIAGGRDPTLRSPRTVDALAALAQEDWVGADDATTLTDDYRALREIEHRVQMIADQQTHKLPATEEEFRRLACLCGTAPDDLKADLLDRFARVGRLTEPFFAPGGAKPTTPELSASTAETVSRWPSYPALRSARAQEIFQRVRPMLLQRLARTERPDEVLITLDRFLAGLPAGVQLFSLFEANPQLLDMVVDISETAPGLAAYLSRNARVFDAVIGGDFFSPWPGAGDLRGLLEDELSRAGDYERQLDRARTWAKEWNFRVGVHLLRGLIDADTAGAEYADVAEATVAALWPAVVADFSTKHGSPPGEGAAILAMGSLGAGRLTATSDLDLILIYDGGTAEASEGRRPLATRTYYARLTQAIVTALSAATAEGRLYEVDMRLRPSGRQGPVATSLAGFKSYQSSEAWTWEHLALTRARPVAGSAPICEELERFRRELLSGPRDRTKILTDVSDMRARLFEAKAKLGPLDAKTGPGRLTDLELAAEAGTLLEGAPARELREQIEVAAGALDLDADQLHEAARLYRAIATGLALVSDKGAAVESLPNGAMRFLARTAGLAEDVEIFDHLDRTAARLRTALDAALAVGPGEELEMTTDQEAVDPKGLIRESYRIDGIQESECRSIFFDWALSVPAGQDEIALIKRLLGHYGQKHPLHPMTGVLKAALEDPPAKKRRGGRAGRMS